MLHQPDTSSLLLSQHITENRSYPTFLVQTFIAASSLDPTTFLSSEQPWIHRSAPAGIRQSRPASTPLQTASSNRWFRAPRSALRNVSNGQSASIRGSSSFDWHKTPVKESQGVLSASAKRIHLSIRRELSKSHGDLSNLRPKSPPIKTLPAGMHGLCLSPGKHVDDTQGKSSPSYNASYNRQVRQAIPNDWKIGASSSHPLITMEGCDPTSQQIHHGPLHDLHLPHHRVAEPATISIRGLTSGYIQPLDFCVPVTRSHPGDEDQRRKVPHDDTGGSLAVEHIDISTAWNGLSDVDANELFRVHSAFVSTLETMLANEIWQIYHQLQQQDSSGNIRPIHSLFSAGVIRGISFCRDQLVSKMAEALYSSKENAAKAKSGILRLYLVANDTLVNYQEDGSHDTSIRIRMRCDPSPLGPYPVVDAAWVPDSLMFEGLNEFPLEGQNFSVVPRYYSKSAFRLTRFPENVTYFIESESRHSPLSWLVWDDEIAGFEGIVPFYSEANNYDRHVATTGRDSCEGLSHSLNIIVRAVLVDDNSSSIRYERILRARLTIIVVPWYVNGNFRGNKERFSVPKAYQDRRLVSTAYRFALDGHGGGPLCPRQSLSELSQWSKGDQLDTSTGYIHTGLVGFRGDCPAMSSSARAGLKQTDITSLAQTQASLVARCAELTRELQNVKKHIVTPGPFGEHPKRLLHATNQQKSTDHTNCIPFDHRTGRNERTSRSSVPCIPHYAWECLTPPAPPSLHGKDAAFQLGPTARFSALPPPAIGPRTPPRLDLQIRDESTIDATRTGWDSPPKLGSALQFAASGGPMTQSTQSTRQFDYLWHLPEQSSVCSNDISTLPSSRQQYTEAPSAPLLVKGELANVSSIGKRSRKRRARSSLNKLSSLRRPEETGKRSKKDIGAQSTEPHRTTLPLLDPEDEASCIPTQSSSGSFYNFFGPLHNLRSSAALVGEDILALYTPDKGASTHSRENLKDPNLNSGCYMNTESSIIDELASKISRASSGLDDVARTGEGLSPASLFSDRKGQVHRCQSPSASIPCRHTSISSSCGSCSTPSDIDLIVEQDPRAREVSRQEQARSWRLLSRSGSNKNLQPGPESEEVRLSEDEKKAMDEAMQRSLDDLAEGFDDIFLEDSSESNSGDDEL